MSANALDVALLVHHLAVLVGCFVGIQVDRLLADRAGKLSFPRSGRYAHDDLIFAYAESLPPMLYTVHRIVLWRLVHKSALDVDSPHTFHKGKSSAILEPMLNESPRVCWICHKPVAPDILRDSFGFFAHEECIKVAAQKEKNKRA